MGEFLLMDAIRRCLLLDGAWTDIVFEALHDHVASWYGRYGFTRILANPLRLVLPRATACKLDLGTECRFVVRYATGGVHSLVRFVHAS